MIRLAALLALLIASPALGQICRTCNSRSCSHVQRVQVVERVVQAETPQVFIINNIPGVPAGSSTYSSSASSRTRLELINVDRLAQQVLAMMKSARDGADTFEARGYSFLERVIQIQEPAVEIVAKGEAAERALAAAGAGVNLTQEEGGGAAENGLALVRATCLECHRGESASKGFRVDQPFDSRLALEQIASGKMPPDGVDTDKRLALILELLQAAKDPE